MGGLDGHRGVGCGHPGPGGSRPPPKWVGTGPVGGTAPLVARQSVEVQGQLRRAIAGRSATSERSLDQRTPGSPVDGVSCDFHADAALYESARP
jgi:hypothetical protein